MLTLESPSPDDIETKSPDTSLGSSWVVALKLLGLALAALIVRVQAAAVDAGPAGAKAGEVAKSRFVARGVMMIVKCITLLLVASAPMQSVMAQCDDCRTERPARTDTTFSLIGRAGFGATVVSLDRAAPVTRALVAGDIGVRFAPSLYIDPKRWKGVRIAIPSFTLAFGLGASAISGVSRVAPLAFSREGTSLQLAWALRIPGTDWRVRPYWRMPMTGQRTLELYQQLTAGASAARSRGVVNILDASRERSLDVGIELPLRRRWSGIDFNLVSGINSTFTSTEVAGGVSAAELPYRSWMLSARWFGPVGDVGLPWRTNPDDARSVARRHASPQHTVVSSCADLSSRSSSVWAPRAGLVTCNRVGLFDRDRSFRLTEENDAFSFATGSPDFAYTQGLGLQWTFAAAPQLPHYIAAHFSFRHGLGTIPVIDSMRTTACGRTELPLVLSDSLPECSSVASGLTQTIFTPEDLLNAGLQPTDRPYAGILALTFGMTELSSTLVSTTELQIGAIGRWAFGEHLQRLAHWTWAFDRPRPRGWAQQLGLGLLIGVRSEHIFTPSFLQWCDGSGWAHFPRVGCLVKSDATRSRIFDASAIGKWELSTVFQRASIGARVRAGWNIDQGPSPRLGFNVQKAELPFADSSVTRKPTLAVLDSVRPTRVAENHQEQRGRPAPRADDTRGWWRTSFAAFAHAQADVAKVAGNALISGTPWSDAGSLGWQRLGRIRPKENVGEISFGVSLRISRVYVDYSQVFRSPEFSRILLVGERLDAIGPRHAVGVVSIGLSSFSR